MVQKLGWLLLVSVICCLCQNSYGSNDSSKEDFKAFGYELVQVQLDHMMNSQNQISKELTQVRDSTMETSKNILEKQNALMEKLLSSVLTQGTQMERLMTTTNHTNHILNRIMNEHNHDIESCIAASSSGLYRLICDSCPTAKRVYCEMGSFGGGWIVIQQRLDGSVNFTRNWQEYREGFGTVGKSTEFWLGLELIHEITNRGSYELAIELKDEDGEYGYARYADFKIAEEEEKYRLSHLGRYSGTIGDKLSYHKDMKFTTFDQDNDERNMENCSQIWYSNGGWWYKNCARGALNGAYTENQSSFSIRWDGFSDAATFSRMMIRRK